MKKTYETPSIEVVKFQYRDQVVVASGSSTHECTFQHTNAVVGCTQDTVITQNSVGA